MYAVRLLDHQAVHLLDLRFQHLGIDCGHAQLLSLNW
jgi:hypothetical protein